MIDRILEFLVVIAYPFTWSQLSAAVLCGGLVGLERQLRRRPAGVRTSVMICLGSEMFVTLGSTLVMPGTDPSRVLGQVITGVGFLGAGVMLARGSKVTGVTSASVIWILAAVGATIGLGFVNAAITVTVVALFLLTSLDVLLDYIMGQDSGEPSQTRGAKSLD